MKSKPGNNHRPFLLALYPSLIIGLVSGVLQTIILNGLSDLSWTRSIIYSSLFTLIIISLSYLTLKLLHQRRTTTLSQILENMGNKEFRNYNYLEISNRDELDGLIQQTIQTNHSVADQIEQMSETEDYRKDFIGDISHELKTPIFAIQGFIETLLDGAIDDENVNRRFLQKTMRHVNRLIYLTQDLMEISRLESGELEANFQSIYLRELIMDVVESLQHNAEQEGITLETDPIESGLTVYADRHQVRRALTNLIDNAIKYNRENGKVIVGVTPYGQDKRHKRVLVYVEDTGIGIDEKQIERVTERFFRVDKSRSRQKGGTGLGLAIVKHIMEGHGEELFIESTPGEGSTFSFTLTEVHYPA